jgi:hypothetical protein
MSAICLRYKACPEDKHTAAHLHASVARQVEAEGRFWISTTVLKGKTWFRINPVNFRTELGHMDALFGLLRARCKAVAASLITGAGSGPELEQQP